MNPARCCLPLSASRGISSTRSLSGHGGKLALLRAPFLSQPAHNLRADDSNRHESGLVLRSPYLAGAVTPPCPLPPVPHIDHIASHLVLSGSVRRGSEHRGERFAWLQILSRGCAKS